ncbi:hypothetical protein [Carboxylicivirga sp. RSCT41]|uniref:hypothetical protein n=1 Tax=Carboxylicivirga agarovorans TaxID=3417570 RepID=UPI003D325A3D
MKSIAIVIIGIALMTSCQTIDQHQLASFKEAININLGLDSVVIRNNKNLSVDCYTYTDESDFDNEMTISLITYFLGKHYSPNVIPLDKKLIIKLVDTARVYSSSMDLIEAYRLSATADSAFARTFEIFSGEGDCSLVHQFRESQDFDVIMRDTLIRKIDINGLVKTKFTTHYGATMIGYKARMRILGINRRSLYLYFNKRKELEKIELNKKNVKDHYEEGDDYKGTATNND